MLWVAVARGVDWPVLSAPIRGEIAELAAAAVEGGLRRIRQLIGKRRRYLEIQA
jgi:hypothetical protein